MTETEMIDAVTIYETMTDQHETIKRLEGEAKVLRDLLDDARDFIPDFEYAILDKIAKAIRGTV